MKKIVYLIGAGASYNSLPIVDLMADRMQIFIDVLKDYCKGHNETEKVNTLDKYKKLIDDIVFFGTPDTLARKYYLSPSRDDNYKLFDLKNFISSFFIFEQLEKADRIRSIIASKNAIGMGISEPTQFLDAKKNLYNGFWETLDKRYLSFFAAICKKNNSGELVLPPNVSVISWNYDVQIERAFQEFVNEEFHRAQIKLNVYPGLDGNIRNVEEKIENEFCILKLNGTAGFYSSTESLRLFDPKFHSANESSINILTDLLTYSRKKYNNLLHFAWENEETRLISARKIARKKIQEANEIVVIGYSFGEYNRLVDMEIFSDEKVGKVYLQDPNADNIVVKLDETRAGLKSKVEKVYDVKNFKIPNEIRS